MMKSYTEYLWFQTKKHREIVYITDQIESIVKKSKIQEGLVVVGAMHITASVYINDNENGLFQDMEEWLQRLCPEGPDYQHHRSGETNGDAHLKNLLMGHQVVVPITQGKLDLGPWQSIFYFEFDGQRRKRVLVKAIGD